MKIATKSGQYSEFQTSLTEREKEEGEREGEITVCCITKENLKNDSSSPLTDAIGEKKAIDSTHIQKGQTLTEGCCRARLRVWYAQHLGAFITAQDSEGLHPAFSFNWDRVQEILPQRYSLL